MTEFLEFAVPCFAVVSIIGIIFGSMVWMRYYRHEETKLMIQQGLVKPEDLTRSARDTLRWGVIITVLGLALCIGVYPLGFIDDFGSDFPLYFGPWMLVGLLPTFFGIGLLIIHFLADKPEVEEVAEEEVADVADLDDI